MLSKLHVKTVRGSLTVWV